MIIHLNEIPQEGKIFYLNRQTGELNEALSDLIGESPFEVECNIAPLGNAHDITGFVKTEVKELCSFCAEEFALPINEKFHEMVVEEDKKSIKGFTGEWTSSSEINVIASADQKFDLGATIREVIALAVPSQPTCREGCKGLCPDCGADLNVSPCRCAEQKKNKASPFSVLKNVKLN